MPKEPTREQLKKRLRTLEKEARETHRVLEELEREKVFSEKVLSSLPGIFYVYDEGGNILRWNKNHEDLTGFSGDEVRQRNALDWFEGEEKAYIAERMEEVFTKGDTEAEAHLIVKNGERIPYYFTGLRMTVDDRKYLLGMGTDISKLKKTEEALRKSEEKFRQIFENAVEGIYQVTPMGRFVSANPAMARILGYDSPEDLVAQVVNIGNQLYVSDEERDEFLEMIQKNHFVAGVEIQYYRKDGTKIWAALHARAVYDENGEMSLIEGIFSDITERKKLTDALIEREEYLSKENILLKSNIKDRYRFGKIIGKSPAMQEVYELVLSAAATDANVIIYGESGTGKELVARAIHDMGDRKHGRFVPVNCGAIPETLLESEFFGYRKGAFTGANRDKEGYLDLADGGSLFLDELGEIDLSMQVKLLRVLEGHGYIPVGGHEIQNADFRVIAATGKNLQDLVRQGLMREDFFYRIHIIPVQLPPLRERKEDIPLLIDHFIEEYDEYKKLPPITGEILDAMLNHSWPGNVRELQNVLHRYVTLNQLDLARPPAKGIPDVGRVTEREGIPGDDELRVAVDKFESRLIELALERNRWHREKAAMSLGVPRRTFFRKLKKHGLLRHE